MLDLLSPLIILHKCFINVFDSNCLLITQVELTEEQKQKAEELKTAGKF